MKELEEEVRKALKQIEDCSKYSLCTKCPKFEESCIGLWTNKKLIMWVLDLIEKRKKT